MHSGPIVVTAPTEYPVTIAELKGHCLTTGSDAELAIYLAAATEYVQNSVGQQLLTATLKEMWDDFGCKLTLLRRPVQSISFVKHYDANGTLTTIASSNYYADLDSRPARIIPIDGYVWPDVQCGRPGAVQVQYVAGQTTPAAVDPRLRLATLQIAKVWFDNRSGIVTSGAVPQPVPHTIDALLSMCGQGLYH